MKSSNWFAFVALAVITKENLVGSVKQNGENSFIASAIGEIVEKFYAKKDHRVDLLCYPCKTTKSVDLLDELLKHKTNVIFRAFSPIKNIEINASTIMIFDKKSDHVVFVTNISFDLFSTTEKYYVIYYPGLLQRQIRMVKNMKYKNFSYLSNHNKSHLSLFTFTYFNKDKCNQTLFKTINVLNKTGKKWENDEDFFPNKFKNFNNCSLNFGKEHLTHRKTAALKKGQTFGGELYEMNEAIAKQLNINGNYVHCPRAETTGRNVCNKSHPFEPEMFLKLSYVPTYNNPFEQLVSFHFESNAGFLIPPGKKLSVLGWIVIPIPSKTIPIPKSKIGIVDP
jgi:hypothetical protein